MRHEIWPGIKVALSKLAGNVAALALVIGCLKSVGIVIDVILPEQERQRAILGLVTLDSILWMTEISVAMMFASLALKEIIVIIQRIRDKFHDNPLDEHRRAPFVQWRAP